MGGGGGGEVISRAFWEVVITECLPDAKIPGKNSMVLVGWVPSAGSSGLVWGSLCWSGTRISGLECVFPAHVCILKSPDLHIEEKGSGGLHGLSSWFFPCERLCVYSLHLPPDTSSALVWLVHLLCHSGDHFPHPESGQYPTPPVPGQRPHPRGGARAGGHTLGPGGTGGGGGGKRDCGWRGQ